MVGGRWRLGGNCRGTMLYWSSCLVEEKREPGGIGSLEFRVWVWDSGWGAREEGGYGWVPDKGGSKGRET